MKLFLAPAVPIFKARVDGPVGDAGHGLGVLGAYPSEVSVDAGKDLGGFLGAKFGFKPSGGGAGVFLIVAAKLTVASWYAIKCGCSWTVRVRKRNKVFYSHCVEQASRPVTISTAATEIVKSALPLMRRQGIGEIALSRASPRLSSAINLWALASIPIRGIFLSSLIALIPLPLFGELAGSVFCLPLAVCFVFSFLIGGVPLTPFFLRIQTLLLFSLGVNARLAPAPQSVTAANVTMEVIKSGRLALSALRAILCRIIHTPFRKGLVRKWRGEGLYGASPFEWVIKPLYPQTHCITKCFNFSLQSFKSVA